MSRRGRLVPFDPTGELSSGATLLEASAGTGKTYQITSLALRFVAEFGVPLPTILVVTFTRAATSELRDRVRGRLRDGITTLERALAEPGWEPDGRDEVLAHLVRSARGEAELETRLRRLVAAREDFDDATIATIHGFCQETLRHSAFESDVDLEAELVEDIDDLLEEAVHDLIVRDLGDASDDWYAYLRANRVDRADLLDLARALEAEPHLRVLPEDVTGDPAAAWAETVASFREAWAVHGTTAREWLHERVADRSLTRKHIYIKYLDDYLDAVDEWCAGVAARYPRVAGNASDFTADELRGRTGDAYLASPVFDAFTEICAVGGDPATAFKVRFAERVVGEVSRRKRARNVLSFNDLLRALREGLDRPGTREALRAVLTGRFEAALIDEFQDTDPVQWAIFDAVFGEHGHLYLIGDPKQAIYAFRGADVRTYLDAADRIDTQRTLATNWRSDRDYVAALNRLFSAGEEVCRDDDRGVLGNDAIPYIEVDAAHAEPRLSFPEGPRPALEIVHVPRDLAGVDPTAKITAGWADQHLPAIVAADVVGFLTSGAVVADDDGERGVLPRDVAVLTRTNAQAASVQDALRTAGVHAVASGGGSVFASPEAGLLQRLLTGVHRPHVDREVRAALTTPLLGVTGDELVAMDDADWEDWINAFAGWSATWHAHGVAEMARHAFDETGVRARLLALPSGERRLTNLLHLLELAHAAEQGDRLGPSALVGWLADRRADPPEDREATELRLESDEDAATVVTVHRAKGLEYPAVWCPWLWRSPTLGARRNLRLHHPDDGDLALDVTVDKDDPTKARHVEIAKRETWEESLRLLYVALTRARHRCTVHWGALHGAGNSPLGRVLHGWGLDDPSNPSVEDEQLRARLDEIAAGSDGTIGVRTATVEEAAYAPPADPDDELTVRRLSRDLDRRWQRTSFSRLTREGRDQHGVDDAEVRDVDAGTAPSLREAAAADSPPVRGPDVPLADFPRGPAAGTFLHDVLERLDFTRPDEQLASVLDEQRRRHALEIDPTVPLAAGLRAVLDTPLGPLAGDARLADIAPDDRLVELAFDLPLAGGYRANGDLHLDRLADLLAAHADEVPLLGRYASRLRTLGARRARGFLTGSIDLVIRAPIDGHPRYVVADHKSNWLGDRGPAHDRSTIAHYHPDALAEAMVEHHYLLQALLYLVAVHRLLRWRLGDAYDYEADVGGIAYLFLRGMVGAETPVTGAGDPHGVFALRPPRALVDDLDTLLARGEVVR